MRGGARPDLLGLPPFGKQTDETSHSSWTSWTPGSLSTAVAGLQLAEASETTAPVLVKVPLSPATATWTRLMVPATADAVVVAGAPVDGGVVLKARAPVRVSRPMAQPRAGTPHWPGATATLVATRADQTALATAGSLPRPSDKLLRASLQTTRATLVAGAAFLGRLLLLRFLGPVVARTTRARAEATRASLPRGRARVVARAKAKTKASASQQWPPEVGRMGTARRVGAEVAIASRGECDAREGL